MNEFFIAKRYLKAKHKIGFITILSAISWVGITIGVAALVIVISVFNGFSDLVKNLLISYDPHIIITSNISDFNEKKIYSALHNIDGIKNISPVLEGKCVVNSNSNFNMIILKGLNEKTLSLLGIVDKNSSQRYNQNSNLAELHIGQILAAKMGCIIGDTISITSIHMLKQNFLNFTSIPSVQKCIVKSIFATNNKEYDENYVFTNLYSAEGIFGGNYPITTYEIRLSNLEELPLIKNTLQKIFGNSINISTWYDLHKNLYDVMQIERWSAFLLLSMIISVAVFNILSTLTMIVIEKKRDIGILKAMGFNNSSINKLFIFQGILVGSSGIISGLIIGILTCYLQIKFKLYPLDPTKYIIDALPVKVNFVDIFLIAAATLLLASLASIYPAKKAGEINIIESIKYE